MKLIWEKFAASFIATLLIVGCNQGSTRQFDVGTHDFRIPLRYLMDDTKESSRLSGGMPIVTLNPDAQIRDQISALIETEEAVCPEGRSPGPAYWLHLCVPGTRMRQSANRQLELSKVGSEKDVVWRYYDKSGGEELVATCHASTATPKIGLCRHLVRRDDLIITIGLREDQLTDIPQLDRTLDGLLSAWEVGS